MAHRSLRHLLALAFLWGALPTATALAQDPPCPPEPGAAQDSLANAALASAQRLFGLELYDEVVRVLEPCVAALDTPSQREALRLLAISYYETGNQGAAQDAVRRLVRGVDRRYPENREEDPLYLREWVAEFRPKWYENRLVQLGGVAVVSGVLGFILLQPEDTPTPPLAGPPVFPPPSQ